jgi:intraflagellar transport protein 52
MYISINQLSLLKENITSDKLKKINLLILGGPRASFRDDEFKILNTYLEEGGSILILLGEGGEEK